MFHHFRGENQPKAQVLNSAEKFDQFINLVQSTLTWEFRLNIADKRATLGRCLTTILNWSVRPSIA